MFLVLAAIVLLVSQPNGCDTLAISAKRSFAGVSRCSTSTKGVDFGFRLASE